ncbi:MAG: AAA family ATPase, partial [Bacteroidales bacterium]|nr:AAA family ATPase [Bacteroidales bacterium]
MDALQPYVNKTLKLTNEQVLLGQTLVEFYSNPQKQVLVIDGYAGTGKTTLISAFVKYVVAKDKPVALLASTGRAAKILSDKASFLVETVHKHIYKLEIQEVDEINKTKKLVFMLKGGVLPLDATIIVDEASMISNHAIRSGFLHFGSGRVLTDLLSYANARKIIFVGDSCQLPPVNVPVPPVFDIGYIEKHF